MDLGNIDHLLSDNFDKDDGDEDLDDNLLESELNSILSGKPTTAKVSANNAVVAERGQRAKGRRPPPPQRRAPPKPEVSDPDEGEVFDIDKLVGKFNFDETISGGEESEVDENDESLLAELGSIVKGGGGRKPTPVESPSKQNVNVAPPVPRRPVKTAKVEPEAQPLLSNEIEHVKKLQVAYKREALKAKSSGDKMSALNFMKVSKQLDSILGELNSGNPVDMSTLPPNPDQLAAAAAEMEIDAPEMNEEDKTKLFNAPTSASSVLEALQQRLAKFKSTQEQATAENNSSKARRLGRIVKQYETAIKDHQKGKQIDTDGLPCPPGFPPFPTDTPAVAKPAPAAPKPQLIRKAPAPPPAQPVQQAAMAQSSEADEEIEPPEMDDADKAKLFNAPTSASSVLEALEQRLAKFKSTLEQATAESNTSKARRLGRIVKQYETAIKDHKRGKPIDTESLPCPPGFPPFPSEETKPAPKPAPAASARRPAPAAQPAAAAAATRQRPPLKKQLSTVATKQLNYLTERQRLFREAAMVAKKRGELDQAKEYLRSAKGFDPLIQATMNGLPIDATSIPTPPQLSNNDFVMIASSVPDTVNATIEGSHHQFEGDDERNELFKRIEKELIEQIDMCNRNKEYFLKLGDIGTSSKFEKYGNESRLDLNMLQVRYRNGDNIPSFRTETRTFSIVVSNPEVGLNEVHVEIVKGYDFPGKPEIDTYVRLEFPYPTEKPQTRKTKTVYNTVDPEFNESFSFEFDRKSRSTARIFKRQPLKCEIYVKGGFLRSDILLGTVLIKLSDFETKCTIHECFPLTEGRKVKSGRLEVKVKLREPLLAKQIEEINEKWIVFT